MKSSEKLYSWLIHHKILGLYVRSYITYKAISCRAKIISITALWAVISTTIVFFIDETWLRILLVFIAAGVTIYLVQIKTLTKEMLESAENRE